MKTSAIFPLLFFGLIWSGFVVCFDAHFAGTFTRQFVSRNFPSVTGQVTHSEVIPQRGSKGGVNYRADIRYRYVVNNQRLEGSCYRYNNRVSTSYPALASETVNAHPVGSAIQVFYNPSRPSDALLSPGIDGSDMMIVLFLMPFNLITLAFWVPTAGWLNRKYFKSTPGGVDIIKTGTCTRVRLPQFPAFALAFATAGGLSFVMLFVAGFSTGFHPQIKTVVVILFWVFGAGAAAYFWQWRTIHGGDDDLVLDFSSCTVGLPETFGRKQRVMVAFSDIEAARVETITHYGKNGVSYTYAPGLRPRGRDFERLADWSDQERAEALAAWLCEQLGLKSAGKQ